jgi:hypothetical protein
MRRGSEPFFRRHDISARLNPLATKRFFLVIKSSSVLVAKYKKHAQNAAVPSRIKIVDWVELERESRFVEAAEKHKLASEAFKADAPEISTNAKEYALEYRNVGLCFHLQGVTSSNCATIFSGNGERIDGEASDETQLAENCNMNADKILILIRDALQTKKDAYCEALRKSKHANILYEAAKDKLEAAQNFWLRAYNYYNKSTNTFVLLHEMIGGEEKKEKEVREAIE